MVEELLWGLRVVPPVKDKVIFLFNGKQVESLFKHGLNDKVVSLSLKVFFLNFAASISRREESFELVPFKLSFRVQGQALSFEGKVLRVVAI